jgi:hypothetical protein
MLYVKGIEPFRDIGAGLGTLLSTYTLGKMQAQQQAKDRELVKAQLLLQHPDLEEAPETMSKKERQLGGYIDTPIGSFRRNPEKGLTPEEQRKREQERLFKQWGETRLNVPSYSGVVPPRERLLREKARLAMMGLAPETVGKIVPPLEKPGKLYETERGFLPREAAIGLAKPEKEEAARLYETEKGWQPRELAVGLQKPSEKKVPTMKKMLNADRIMTWHSYDSNTKSWIDTGKRAEKPTKITPEKPSVLERRKIATAKDLAKAEEMISDYPDDPAIQGYISLFNEFAEKPYMYLQVEEPGRIWGKSIKLKTIPLPEINGKQVTAKDVTYTAKQEGLTIKEVLRHIGALK